MSVRYRRIPPSRLSAAAAGEAPAAPYGTSGAVESPSGSTPNATHDVPCPVPPPGRPGPRATPKPSGRGRPAGWFRARWRDCVLADAASGRGTQPVGPGLVAGTASRSAPGLRRGRPAGRLGSGDGLPSRTPSPAGMSSRLVPDLVAGLRLGERLAFGGDVQPVGPRSGGGVPSRRLPPLAGHLTRRPQGLTAGFRLDGRGLGLRRGCPAGRSQAGGGVPPRRTPGLRRGRRAGRPGSGRGTSSRSAPGLRRGRPAGWSRVWWRDFVAVGARPPAGTSSRSARVWWRGSVSGRGLAFGGTPDPSAPGPAAGFRPGGRGVPGRRPPSGLCRTESPAPARRSSAGLTVRPRQDRGHRMPNRSRPQSAWTHRPRSRRLLRGDPAPPRHTPSRPTLRNPLR